LHAIECEINKQEAFEKCWAHSPLRAAHAHSPGVASGTVARRLRIDVHDIDNDDNDDDNDNDNDTGSSSIKSSKCYLEKRHLSKLIIICWN